VLVPLIDGLAKFAFKFNAANCALAGLFASDILSTFVKPTIAFVIPLTVPVNVGEAKFAFKFNAANCALDTGLFASDIIYIC
jgi:hypothetical protein